MSADLSLDDSRIQTIIGVFIVLTIGAAVLGGIASDEVGPTVTDQFERASGDTIHLDRAAEDPTLEDTAGNQAAFGSGSASIDAPTDGAVGDGNTTAVVWPALSDDALASDAYHVATFGNVSASLQYRDGQWYAAYNKTGGGVAEVTAPAPAPRTRTMVGLVANGTHLGIVRGGDVVNTTAFAPGDLDVPAARSWWGTQDELRVWGTPLNDSQLASLESDPIGPLAQGETTLRLMLDEGAGSSTYVLPGGQSATLRGAVGWNSSGLAPTAFQKGVDFTFDNERGIVHIVDGSRLDALRVAYVTYDASEDQPIGGVFSRLEVIALVMFLMLAVAVIAVKEEFV